MNARRTLTLLARGEVVVPVASLSVVALLIATLLSWGPAWSQARAEARAEAAARAAAAARAWRTESWTITVADVPQGAVVPVQDDWLGDVGPWYEHVEAPVPYRVPGLRHLMAGVYDGYWAPLTDVQDSLHGVRSGPVEVFSQTFVIGSAAAGGHALAPDLLVGDLRDDVRQARELAARGGEAVPADDPALLVDPEVSTTCPSRDACPRPAQGAHRLVVTGVEAVPSWIEPRRVTVAATWVDDVLVAVATLSPVGADVPDEVSAPHLLDVLAAKVRADPPAPAAEDLTEAAVSRPGAGGEAR
jgi:hypothetical protein